MGQRSPELLTGLIWAFYNVGFNIILAFGPDFLMAQGWHTEVASAMVSTMAALFSAIAAVLVAQYFLSAETNTRELLPAPRSKWR